MTTFLDAIESGKTRTENGMVALKTSQSDLLDLFFDIGAASNTPQALVTKFLNAYQKDKDLALRILQWGRDIREGAGRREIYRQALVALESYWGLSDHLKCLILKTPELGRWDDLFFFKTPEVKEFVFSLIREELQNNNHLLAKWLPRQKGIANELRAFLKLSPKAYRKLLVNLSNGIVEHKMCAKQFNQIDFAKVPSIAHSRYRSAFIRNAKESYAKFLTALKNGETTIKAGAIYPHEIVHSIFDVYNDWYDSSTEEHEALIESANAQWEALPNYFEGQDYPGILPMVDVSGSMNSPIASSSGVTAMDVAMSLGVYISERNIGPFKDLFLSFSGDPTFHHLSGNLYERVTAMLKTEWGFNTNIEKAFMAILEVAKLNQLAPEAMPKVLLILSDMQFDQSQKRPDATLIDLAKHLYKEAGYELPKIIFWNLVSKLGNVPVRFKEDGTGLVSGFSPSILMAILKCAHEPITPEKIMLETIMKDRYNIDNSPK